MNTKQWKLLGIYLIVGLAVYYFCYLWYKYYQCKKENENNVQNNTQQCNFWSPGSYKATSASNTRGLQQTCPAGYHFEVRGGNYSCIRDRVVQNV